MRREPSGSLASLRDRNRRLVVDELRRAGLISRAELARRTGLSRSTVSTLIADMQAQGLVAEREVDGAGPQGGRPPVLLSLERAAGVALGIDFGKRHVRVIVSDLAHTVLADLERPMETEQSAQEGFDAAVELAGQALAEAGVAQTDIIGAGMGVPGPIDVATGEVGSSAILPGWVGVRPEEVVARQLGIPVKAENDANLGALAELTWGAGRGSDDFVYIKVSSGIGGGLVLGGQLYTGSGGIAGELGHSMVDEHGPVCRCGNRGCLETIASTRQIVDLLRPARGADITIEQVIAHAREGDRASRRVIGDAARAIGVVIAQVCNVLNPAKVVVGGDLSAAGDVLLDPLRDEVTRHAVPAAGGNVEIVPGVLGRRAEVLGAAALVLRDVDGFALHPPKDVQQKQVG
ncbi:ROK family transcriptional regulator [Conexibacter sp. JD483]|uniref:ROK family transcriptional regulator n=1 Tax=unclassified Conexibacter TaxID=2627773 RepID=UPI002723B985|nr:MULTISPECIES: ROK family transcriptional regulator [unclassified Conexibacter]MDO8184200.1 ROK family transcriptional regulator [Conexibacter sp. CPCC 205706]MDO8197192.1 ROK family transcriptional regulator [Conexibacter sp. CPCC 205762]MDR9367493.1 ROK family transcriptional regulator [Conexibacter sp. JD483]